MSIVSIVSIVLIVSRACFGRGVGAGADGPPARPALYVFVRLFFFPVLFAPVRGAAAIFVESSPSDRQGCLSPLIPPPPCPGLIFVAYFFRVLFRRLGAPLARLGFGLQLEKKNIMQAGALEQTMALGTDEVKRASAVCRMRLTGLIQPLFVFRVIDVVLAAPITKGASYRGRKI